MSRVRWCGLATTLLLAALSVPTGRAAEESQLAGLYACKGVYADRSVYRGFVQIARHGDTLTLTWLFPDAAEGNESSAPAAVGVGIVTGDSLVVGYQSQTMAGLVVYRIEENSRRLVGRWAVAGGDGTLHSEVLTKLGVQVAPSAPEGPHGRQKKSKPAVRTTAL